MEPGGRHSPDSLRPTKCFASTIRQEFSSSRSTIDTNLDCVVQSLAIHTVDSIIIWHRDLVLWPILNNNNQVRHHPPPFNRIIILIGNFIHAQTFLTSFRDQVTKTVTSTSALRHVEVFFPASSPPPMIQDEIGNLECLPRRFMNF